ncbi:ETX/MTX2 family pore-forming toxin [Streptomyces sp. NPDC058953]
MTTASSTVAMADPGTVPCDDKWHFSQVGGPIQDRIVAERFTFDNRKSRSPKKYTERIKTTTTNSFTHSVEVGIEVTTGFNIFAASMSATLRASYGFTATQENSIEKETEIPYEVGANEGYIVYIGFETMKIKGYYERIIGCDTGGQSYQRVGPVTVSVPGVGKAVWSEDLPPLGAV